MILFAFIALFALSYCQDPNVVTFKEAVFSTKEAKSELATILKNYNWLKFLDNSTNWQYTDKGTLWSGTISITTFTAQPPSVSFDSSAATISDHDITITGASDFKIVFTFNYTARTGYNTYPVGMGTVIVTAPSLVFSKKEFKETADVNKTISGSINVTLKTDIAITTGTPIDATLNGYLDKASKDKLNAWITNVQTDLVTVVNAFYDDASSKKKHTIDLETQTPDFNYSMSYNFLADPIYNNNTGITYFYDGKVTRKPKPSGFLTKKDEVNGPTFDPKNGAFQIFISHNLIQNVLSDVSTSGIPFTLTSANQISSQYKLTIEYLGQIIPDVYNDYARDEAVTLSATVKDITFSGAKTGLCNIYFQTLDSKNVSIFEWKSSVAFSLYVDFDLTFTYNVGIFNLGFQSSTITKTVYTNADLEVLNGWITDSLEGYLDNMNKWRLFKQSVDLRTIFSEVTHQEDAADGFYVGGTPKNQTTNATKVMFERQLYRN